MLGKLQKDSHREGDRFLVKVPSLSRDAIVEIVIVEWSLTGEYIKIGGLPSRDWSKASDLWVVESLPKLQSHTRKGEVSSVDAIRKFSDAYLVVEIVTGIVDELRNGKGFRAYWDDLDKDVKADIVQCVCDRVGRIFRERISKLKPEGEI